MQPQDFQQAQNFQQQRNELIQNDYDKKLRLQTLYRQGQISEDKYRKELQQINSKVNNLKEMTSFSKPLKNQFGNNDIRRAYGDVALRSMELYPNGYQNGHRPPPPPSGKSFTDKSGNGWRWAGNAQNGYRYVPSGGWKASKHAYSSHNPHLKNKSAQPTVQTPSESTSAPQNQIVQSNAPQNQIVQSNASSYDKPNNIKQFDPSIEWPKEWGRQKYYVKGIYKTPIQQQDSSNGWAPIFNQPQTKENGWSINRASFKSKKEYDDAVQNFNF
jgi:hypothetical protein